MKTSMLIAFLLAVPAWTEVTNPLGKVIQLLADLAAKINDEGRVEAAAYKEYLVWCGDTSRNKGFEIEEATASIDRLTASIAKHTNNIGASTTDISNLADNIATNDADLAAATTVRNKEAADFAAAEKDLADTIDALRRAIDIISREMAKNPAAFAQVDMANMDSIVKALTVVVDAGSFPSADRKKLLELVQSRQQSQEEDVGSPDAAVYKTHSTNILDVLEDLKEKAEEELANLRKDESNSAHNFAMLKQSLEDQLAADDKALNAAKGAKAASEENKATASGDLTVSNKDLADGKHSLASVKASCAQTTADHEASVAARSEELAVIAKAKEILAATTSGAVEQTYSFLQLQSKLKTRTDLAGAEVVSLVKKLAKEQHSSTLAQLASRIAAVLKYGVSAGEDPFVKVKGLISDLITRLESEADSDATEKAYCDEQIAKTEAKKEDLESDISRLTVKIDKAASASARLKGDVKELQEELANLAKEQAEMDKIRADQRSAFNKAQSELTQGLAGVRHALKVLRDYYGSSASMLQQPDMPDYHSAATGAGQSIIGILEVVESDFAANLAKEETAEDDSEADYQKITQENKITRTTKEQDVKYKTQEFKGLDKSIAELSGDRATTATELDAVVEYYGKIKGRCIAKPETYAERKRRRAAEIAGLKEALDILENQTAFLQRGKKFLGNHGHL